MLKLSSLPVFLLPRLGILCREFVGFIDYNSSLIRMNWYNSLTKDAS